MFFLSILYSKVQLIGAQHSPDHHARSCRTQIFVSLSFSVLLLLNKIMDNNVYQLSEHAMCNGFSFQFQSRAPFENDLLLFLLSFNLISAHLSVSLVFPPFPFFSPSSNFIFFGCRSLVRSGSLSTRRATRNQGTARNIASPPRVKLRWIQPP